MGIWTILIGFLVWHIKMIKLREQIFGRDIDEFKIDVGLKVSF